jgi:hypothetical protein
MLYGMVYGDTDASYSGSNTSGFLGISQQAPGQFHSPLPSEIAQCRKDRKCLKCDELFTSGHR